MIELPPVATRVDREAGYREEISFPLVGDMRVFSVAHLPLDPSIEVGLVICPPILMDLVKNYRHEVLFARSLAARGVAVQRFHYRGSGHSEGDDRDVSAESMIEDAIGAAERLQRQRGIQRIGFLGTRWGAQVVAGAARSYPGAPIVLWEPVVDAGRYFRELIRARLIRETKDPRFARMSSDQVVSEALPQTSRWKQEMAREGRADILGYPLWRRFYDSVKTQQLGEMLADGGGRPLLIVQMSRQSMPRPDLMILKHAIEMVSGTCDVRIIREEPGWMFDGNHRMKDISALLQVSADWMIAKMGVLSHA